MAYLAKFRLGLVAGLLLMSRAFTAPAFAGGQPYLVKDINPSIGSDPMELTRVGDRLFFAADDGIHGRELWVSDGTEAGTHMVVDLRAGVDWSDPVALTEVSGRVFFQARNEDGGLDLYVSDGTAAGTKFVVNQTDGAFYHQTESLDGYLLFQRELPSNDTQLWKSNGTPVGTQLVKDVHVNQMGKSGSHVYFAGVGPGTAIPGFDLWKTNGTAAGTVMLADLEGAIWMTDFNGLVVFNGDLSPEGRELWISDGTPEGTNLLKDINPGSMWSEPAGFTLVNDVVLFSAYEGIDLKFWRTDGTVQGTYSVTDGGAGNITPFNGAAILRKYRPDIGAELWRTDGTEDGTFLIRDIWPGSEHSVPEKFVVASGKVYFRADDGVHGKEMWVTDGTDEGTMMITDLNPGTATGFAQETPVNVNSLLFYTASNGMTGGIELWALDTRQAQIPAASIWGLLSFALLLGAAGTITVLKRKDCVE